MKKSTPKGAASRDTGPGNAAPARTAPKRNEARDEQRRQILLEHRRKTELALQARMQKVRAEGASQLVDNSEGTGVDVQEDITLTLVNTQAALIRRIDQALAHIDAGTYGFCVECRGSIAVTRLRALPFAIRCTACEDAVERHDERARRRASQAASPMLSLPAHDREAF